jgi:hypothetical protein
MRQQTNSTGTKGGRPAGRRARPLSAAQEWIFFSVIFLLGLCLQVAAVLLKVAGG